MRQFCTLVLLLLFLCRPPLGAQTVAHPHTRISLVTFGPGPMIWESLGHTCIRVIDSTKTGKDHDIVYNYGTFDIMEPDAIGKMVRGELMYYLSVFEYSFLTQVLTEKERGIEEQEFLLSDIQKERLLTNLQNNALPRNKYYQYDFFTDNCSSRIYGMLHQTFGDSLVLGQAVPVPQPLIYYDLCRQYYYYAPWLRVGVSVFFESMMNRKVTNVAAMFLPAYLSMGLGKATVGGSALCAPRVRLAADNFVRPTPANEPLIVSCFIALLTAAGFMVKRLRLLGKVMSVLVPLGTGLLGCIILYAWFGTTHAGCENNYNLLWALPTNILLPFLGRKIGAWYALLAMILLCLSLVLYLSGVMVLPLPELVPLFFALLLAYGYRYRRGR